MTQDFAVFQSNDGTFDLVINEETMTYEVCPGLDTAVDFQLFIDQRVTKEDRANALDRQGWIGDLETRGEGYQVGSLLHLRREDNNESAEFAKTALQYFVSIGAAKEISSRILGSNIEGQIIVDDNDVNRYSRLWKATPCPVKVQQLKTVTSVDALTTDQGEILLTDQGEVITTFTKRQVPL